jgi:hypothetical protein
MSAADDKYPISGTADYFQQFVQAKNNLGEKAKGKGINRSGGYQGNKGFNSKS